MRKIAGGLFLLLLAGCQSYSSLDSGAAHATLNISQRGVPHANWFLGDNPCFTKNDASGLLSNGGMFSADEQQFNIKADVPVYLLTSALSGACRENDKLKFTPRAGKVYDSKIDAHCNLSLQDHETGRPPPDLQHISSNDWTFKIRPACFGYLPEK